LANKGPETNEPYEAGGRWYVRGENGETLAWNEATSAWVEVKAAPPPPPTGAVGAPGSTATIAAPARPKPGKTLLEKRIAELDKLLDRGVITSEEYGHRRAAIISDSRVDAASVKKRGGLMKWGMLGCLGIIAVTGLFFVLIIVAIVAAIGGTADQADDFGGDVRVALGPGNSGTIAPESNGSKRSKVTILEVVDGAPSTNQFQQPGEGKKYYAVRVEVENVGTKEVSSLDWKLRDSNDGEVDRTFVSGVGEELELFYNLTPGGKASGWVVFEIPAGATAKWIRADPNPFLADDLYFDAQ
jgi:hypothetical protein